MKKLNRLGLISSILGVFALCGLSALAIISKPKNTERVSASMTQTTLQNVTCEFTNSTISDSDLSYLYSIYSNVEDNFDDYYGYSNGYYGYYSKGKFFTYDLSSYLRPYGFNSEDTYYYLFVKIESTNWYIFGSSNPNYINWEGISIGVLRSLSDISYDNSVPIIDDDYNLLCRWNSNNNSSSLNYLINRRLNFISGVDSNNNELLSIFNYLCTFIGFNSFSDEFLTQEQYQDIIENLSNENSSLRDENDILSEQIQTAYEDGYSAAENYYEEQYNNNVQTVYNQGYTDGYNNGSSQDDTVATIFSGILQVAFVPVNFFLSIFNFEILGINLSGFIRAIFTVAITIIVIKMITGKGGGSE